RPLVELQLDQHTADPGAPQGVQGFRRQLRRQFHETVIGADADMPEITAPQTTLVRDRTHDRARYNPVPFADADAVGGQFGTGGAMPVRAATVVEAAVVEVARCTFPARPLHRLRFGFEEEALA